MMTRKQFAEGIVNEFCKKHNIKREDAHNHIYGVDNEVCRFGIALEVLDELK